MHVSTQKLMDGIDSLNAELIVEAKKKLPSAARLAALSNAIETLQSSQVRQNFSILRYKDGLHPKQAALVDQSAHQTTEIKAPGLIFAQLPKGSFDAVRELVDEAKQSATGFGPPVKFKPSRSRLNP